MMGRIHGIVQTVRYEYPVYGFIVLTIEKLPTRRADGRSDLSFLIADGLTGKSNELAARVSTDRIMKYTFKQAGEHRIDGYARNPEAASTPSYRHIAYDTQVTTQGRTPARGQ